MAAIRVGLVGCGRIAAFHLEALKADHRYEVVAVCDILKERADDYSKKYSAKPYYTLEDMLKTENLDLVTLTTPSGIHPAQALLCARSGRACLSEKPFGVYFNEAEQVVNEFEKLKVPLFVVKQNRYNPTVAKVKQLVAQGLLGKIYLIESNVFWQRPQSYYDAASWRGKRASDGGAFMNQASHYVDLVQWFGGEVVSVKSELATFGRKIECEDTGAALIKFRSGAIGVIAVTMLTYPENLEGTLTLLGEKGTVRIGGKALNKLEVLKIEGYEPDSSMKDSLNYEPKTVYGNGHQMYYEQLPRFLKEPNHKEAITGREGLKSLRLLCQIYGDKV